jgi:hypothetical protein
LKKGNLKQAEFANFATFKEAIIKNRKLFIYKNETLVFDYQIIEDY